MPTLLKKLVDGPGYLVRRARWEFGFCRRLRRHTPVFVYQMGKVGSRSVYESLGPVYPGAVIHGHAFCADYPQGEVRELFQWMRRGDGRRLDVISSVREPLARNISAFFTNFQRDTGVPFEDAHFSIEELGALFLRNFRHDEPLVWFEKHIQPDFGIDVYATPFPPEGYATYEAGGVRLLVFRCELDDAIKERLVRDFLTFPEFRLARSNVAAEKAYADLYRRFKREVRLPAEYVDRLCDSRYFRHFYDPGFIESVRRSWKDGRGGGG